jgi:DNA gyrase/topoisomerase IV subunit B
MCCTAVAAITSEVQELKSKLVAKDLELAQSTNALAETRNLVRRMSASSRKELAGKFAATKIQQCKSKEVAVVGECPSATQAKEMGEGTDSLALQQNQTVAFGVQGGGAPHHDQGWKSRCKAVVSGTGTSAGGHPCHVGCHCDANVDNANRCDMCGVFGSSLDDFLPPLSDVSYGSLSYTAAMREQFNNMKASGKQLENDSGNAAQLTPVAFENNATTSFCPDGAVTPKGFWVQVGKMGKGSYGMCKTWGGAAALSAEPTWCNMISHEEKLCSKMLVAHPQNTPASVGTLVAKRIHCKSNKCSVTKVGICIDVKQPIFVAETCGNSTSVEISSSTCAICNAEATNCDVNNQVLSDNTGAKRTTATVYNEAGVTNMKLDAKSMRMSFADAAMAKLKELGSTKIPQNWEYSCKGTAAERATVLMKLQ